MSSQNNFLELFINDIYKRECVFRIDEEEVDFIRSGIQDIVIKIVNKIIAYNPFTVHYDSLKRVVKTLNDDIKFFTERGGKLTRISKCTENDIMKVGSFYEGTRNRFPDEFDFIFPVYCFEKTGCMSYSSANVISSILDKTYSIMFYQMTEPTMTETERGSLCYISGERNRKIIYSGTAGKKGPAKKLSFFYFNNSEERTEIIVDLVPGAILKESASDTEQIVKAYCRLEPFRKFVSSPGTLLFVQGRVAFTTTEVYFMRDVLQAGHRKMYCVLKYLINGDADISHHAQEYSSYIIKTCIIHHHFKCKYAEKGEIMSSNCILDVLEEMCSYKDSKSIPKIVNMNMNTLAGKSKENRNMIMLPWLEKLVLKLKTLNSTINIYNYQLIMREHRSVAEQFSYDLSHHEANGSSLDENEPLDCLPLFEDL